MKRAIELARLGMGQVSPNPMVGCVIVHEDQIIGEGYHRKFGEAHAEPNAIQSVENKQLLPHSTLYVTLEPCNHYGKTPPCSNLIVETGIRKVVVACVDPFKQVDGAGIQKLKSSGIEVITGILEQEARELNRRFFVNQEQQRPYVVLKWAQTADGFIDRDRLKDEQPLKISNNSNAALVHFWRSREDAILVGANTVLRDNPKLNVRHVSGKNPTRIVIQSRSKDIDYTHFHVADGSVDSYLLAEHPPRVESKLQWISVDPRNPETILAALTKLGIYSVLIEGGRNTLQYFIDSSYWDEARVTTGNITIGTGVASPQIKGVIKDELNTGISTRVQLISPS